MKKILFLMMAVLTFAKGFAADPVKLTFDSDKRGATLTNGLVTIHIKADGDVDCIRYANTDVISTKGYNGSTYLSYVTDKINNHLKADGVKVVAESDDMVEIVYTNTKDSRSLHWEVGYIMRRGLSGYYNYATVLARETSKGKFDNGVHEARIVYRMDPNIFTYAYADEQEQRMMPTPEEMKHPKDTIQDATYTVNNGRIYTKYDYATYMPVDTLHGIMGDKIGAWIISPSHEWENGGVQKQDLTVHADTHSPLLLQMFQSCHLGGVPARYERGQQKMYGPYLVYFNQGKDHAAMIADAKKQTTKETSTYPYKWFKNDLFAIQRGTVKGKLNIAKGFGTTRMQVVLAQPGMKPMLQGTGYQFWTETDSKGNFTIEKVRPGNYTLYAWALNGEATGTFVYDNVTVKEGKNQVGNLTWNADRYGKTVWCIGVSDRTVKGYKFSDEKRQYGLFKKVPADLTFTVGKSKESTDWYYGQTKKGKWNIAFNSNRTYSQPLRLTIATAGAAGKVKANVLVNDKNIGIMRTENDGSIYRSAILSGRDSLFVFDIEPQLIVKGENTITLDLWGMPGNNLGGFMYDCIKLEAKEQ